MTIYIQIAIGFAMAVIGLVLWIVSRFNSWEQEVLRRKKRAWKAAGHLDGQSRGKDLKKMLSERIKIGDEEGFDKLTAEWKAKADEYVMSLKRKSGPRPVNIENKGEGGFDGWLIQKIGWNLLCGFVTVITLGIAYPATLVWKEKWRCTHTLYAGRRLNFDGKASQLIGNWLLWIILIPITAGIFLFFIPGRVRKWKAKHTHISGEYFECGATFDGWLIQDVIIKICGALLTICTLGLALPAAVRLSAKWRAEHTVLDGRRLIFDGKASQLFGHYILWWLLSIVTLTVYVWFIPNRLRNWKAKHTRMETEYELC